MTVTWDFIDSCGNTDQKTQTITVDPAPVATFQNVPADITLDCEDIATFVPDDLIITNNAAGPCEISDTIPGVVTGNYDICGGSLTVT